MIPEHVQPFVRKIIPRDLIDVLVVSERKMYPIEPAARSVNALLGLILRDVRVRIGSKKLWKHHLVRIRASHRKRVTNHGPLRLAIEAEHFPQVVQKSRQNEP